MAEPNHYAVLQVAPAADAKTIETAYRRLARQYHPDLNHTEAAAARMAQVNAAWAVLRDPDARRAYDARRRSAFTQTATAERERDPFKTAARNSPRYALYPPMLEWYTDHLELDALRPGSSASGTLRLKNIGGGTLSGSVTVSSPQIVVTPAQFEGNEVVLTVTASLGPDDHPRRTEGYLAWRVGVDSNGGETSFTVRAPYQPVTTREHAMGRLIYRIELVAAGAAVVGLLAWLAIANLR